jgi:hypothetical protein
VDLRPPTLLRAFAGAEGIRAEWSPVDGAAGYEVRVDDAEGTRVSPAPEADVAGTSAFIARASVAGRGYVEVRARATVPGAVGTWSAPQGVHLASPTGADDDHDGPVEPTAQARSEDASADSPASTETPSATDAGIDCATSPASAADGFAAEAAGAPSENGARASADAAGESSGSTETPESTGPAGGTYPPAESDESGESGESGGSDESSEDGPAPSGDDGASEQAQTPVPQHVPGVETIPGIGGLPAAPAEPDAEEVEAVG